MGSYLRLSFRIMSNVFENFSIIDYFFFAPRPRKVRISKKNVHILINIPHKECLKLCVFFVFTNEQ